MLTLKDSIDNPLLFLTCAPGGQVARNGLVDLDHSSLFIDNMELVFVGKLVVSGPQFTDGFVMLIH